MKPTVGRIVHYVLSSWDGVAVHNLGEHRPAIVVKMWCSGSVQLQVFTDGQNDRMDGAPMIWVTSVEQDEAEKKPGTWHWPERDEETV